MEINKLKNLLNNLSNLKNKVDKLYIDQLVPISIGLWNLTNIKITLLKRMNNNAKTKNIEDKIPVISKLATKIILNTKTK